MPGFRFIWIDLDHFCFRKGQLCPWRIISVSLQFCDESQKWILMLILTGLNLVNIYLFFSQDSYS